MLEATTISTWILQYENALRAIIFDWCKQFHQ
jgi:hypothetical protein